MFANSRTVHVCVHINYAVCVCLFVCLFRMFFSSMLLPLSCSLSRYAGSIFWAVSSTILRSQNTFSIACDVHDSVRLKRGVNRFKIGHQYVYEIRCSPTNPTLKSKSFELLPKVRIGNRSRKFRAQANAHNPLVL